MMPTFRGGYLSAFGTDKRIKNMAITWNASNCPTGIEAMRADVNSKEWLEYANMRDSLIYCIVATGFPPSHPWRITEGNWRDMFMRINRYEQAGGAFRHAIDDDGGHSNDVYFTPEDIQGMIGLEVNAGNKTPTEFNKFIAKVGNDRATQILRRYEEMNDG